MVIHEDCDTKEDIGCFYGCCNKCEYYTTKDKQGNIHFYNWDNQKQEHIEVNEG